MPTCVELVAENLADIRDVAADMNPLYIGVPPTRSLDSAAVAPASPDEAHKFWQKAYDTSEAAVGKPITISWSTTADITEVLNVHGDGVYTVVLWDKIGDEDVRDQW